MGFTVRDKFHIWPQYCGTIYRMKLRQQKASSVLSRKLIPIFSTKCLTDFCVLHMMVYINLSRQRSLLQIVSGAENGSSAWRMGVYICVNSNI